MLDDRAGCARAHATRDQGGADLGERADPHVADQGRMLILRQQIPAHLGRAALVRGHEGQAHGLASIGHRDVGRGRHRNARCDAGNRLTRNARRT